MDSEVFMKRFFHRLFKGIFAALVIAAVAGFFAGWVNIWIPSGKTGIIRIEHSDKQSEKTDQPRSFAVQRKGFTWIWQRLIPGWTSLTVVDTGAREYAFEKRAPLPAALEYAAISGRDIADFTADLSVVISYSLDAKALPEYLTGENISDAYSLERIVLGKIAGIADAAARDSLLAVAGSSSAASASSSFGDAGAQSPAVPNVVPTAADIAAAVEQSVLAAAKAQTASTAITVQSVSARVTRMPDIAAYLVLARAMQESADAASTTAASSRFADNKEALTFYLYFIQRLGALAAANPNISGIIQAVPPKDILPQ